MKNFEFAKLIAAALLGTWEAKAKGHDNWDSDPDDMHRILAPNGAGLLLSFRNMEKGRINISGVWPYRKTGTPVIPSSLYPSETAPDISVSATKAPELIAKDIERRFLSVYLPLWEKCVVHGNNLNSQEDKELASKLEVANVLGCTLSETDKRPDGRPRFHGAFNGPQHKGMYIWTSYFSIDGSISVDLRNIPHDLAIEMFKLLQKGVPTK